MVWFGPKKSDHDHDHNEAAHHEDLLHRMRRASIGAWDAITHGGHHHALSSQTHHVRSRDDIIRALIDTISETILADKYRI